MEYREIAPGTSLPVLGLGTWHMGESNAGAEEIQVIRKAIELGMTHIDTAEMYAAGGAEEVVGEAIKGLDRGGLFITTKALPSHFAYSDLIKACQGSIKRLAVHYVDLYLLHWPSHSIPLEETMRGLDYLVEQGQVRFIGVSNFSVELVEEAQSYTKNKIVTNQVEYSLVEQNAGSDILPYCQEHKALLTAYTPLGSGELAQWGFNSILDETAKKYDKTPAQVALNWLIVQDNVVTVPKTASCEHVEENAQAVGWKLSQEDFQALSGAF